MLNNTYLPTGHVGQVKYKAPVEFFNIACESSGSTNFESDSTVSRGTQLMRVCCL